MRASGLLALVLLACGSEEPPPTERIPTSVFTERPQLERTEDMSPNAQLEAFGDLLLAEEFEAAPSDGGGRAWVRASDPQPLQSGSPGRIELVYEAGPLGIEVGGSVSLQVSPFWGWSTPHTQLEDSPGYTTVATEAEGVRLHVETLGEQLLGIQIQGRALAKGERIEIVYGAGPAGVAVDEFADADSRFWFAVDGDGDGFRRLIDDSPSLVVVAGPPDQLFIHGPSVARPGEPVSLHIAVLDALGNAGTTTSGVIELRDETGLLEMPTSVELPSDAEGVLRVEARGLREGITRVHAQLGEWRATSNPLQVSANAPRILWGDLHGHTSISDGTGTPDDYFRYARDVAGLDLIALTDHDHWGMQVLADEPALWAKIKQSTLRFHEPGRFVTLLGFEWTSWLYGHRHVLYFSDEGRVIDSVDEETRTPTQLWQALEGQRAMTFAHHTPGEPVATAWDYAPDPRFEPVVEIVSVHGSSEAADGPPATVGAIDGYFVRDALERGYRLGFIGSGDSHDGHPGLAHVASATGGLAAILSEERTRDGVLEALHAKRSYATNGARIILRMGLGSARMGETMPAPPADAPPDLYVQLIGTAPFDHVDIIRRGEAVERLPLEGRWEAGFRRTIEGLEAGDWIYVRAEQNNRGAAWSSPIFIGEPAAAN